MTRQIIVAFTLSLFAACSADPSSAAGAIGDVKSKQSAPKPTETNVQGIIMPVDLKAAPTTNVKGIMMPPGLDVSTTNVKGLVMPPAIDTSKTNVQGLVMPPAIDASKTAPAK